MLTGGPMGGCWYPPCGGCPDEELLELGPFPRSELLGGLGGIDCCCPTAGDIDLEEDDPVGDGVGRMPGVPR
jgi:hypothetical protein